MKKIFKILAIMIIFYLISIIVESYYKINYHYNLNPELYKLPTNTSIYNLNLQNVSRGKQIAKNSKIAICGLARNISNNLEKTKIRMEYIGNQFHEYKIVIFENDSQDNSRELLKKWSNDNSNVILLDCCRLGNCDCKLKKKKGYDYGTFSNERFKNMAIYRQQYVDYVNHNLNNYDYMLVVDYDLDGNININGLYDSLNKDNWDAIFCNGKVPLYGTYGLITVNSYDTLALVFNDEEYTTEKLNLIEALYKTYKIYKEINNYHYLPVKSAFNGYGIYKIKSIRDCSYIGNTNLCEHVNFNKCLNDKNKKLFINLLWVGYFDIQGDNPFRLFLDFFKH